MMACSTPGHEEKSEHGRSGLCQACYRRERRRALDPEVGTRAPGPKPKEGAVSHRKLSDEEKVARRAARKAAKTICVNNHELTEQNSYVTAKGQKVCRICTRNAQQRFHGRPETGDAPVGPRNADKTHCRWGHEYTPENTYVMGKDKSRSCKTCWREHRLMRTYGLRRGQYDEMYEEQGGHCAGCEVVLEEGKNLHVDHDHETGAVRGLLCTNCNNALGRVKDDVDTLRRLADYVDAHRARGKV